jgi:hypothetical protein
MGTTLRWVLILLSSAIALLGGLWIIIPTLSGLAWIPSRRKRIRRALEMAGVKPGETLYDLGAGDGRVLVIAAREFQARAIGIEIEPIHCTVAWLWACLSGVSDHVSVRCQNFFHADLRDADVIFVYLTSKFANRLQSQFRSQLRAGARIVSISADLKGWQPAAIDDEHLIFLYHMPPTPIN